MWFRLAAQFGCSVGEAQDRVDAEEFAEWMAYYSIEPFGGERLDIGLAQVCAIIANALKSKGGKSYGIEDFMLFTGKNAASPKQLTPEQQQAFLMRALGGETS